MRLLLHLGCLLLGAAVALAAVAVHRSAFPAGLVLALVTTFAVSWWLLGSRRPRTAASYVLGWLAVLVLAALGRPEGDYALASDFEGYALLVAGLPLMLVGILSLAGVRGSRDEGAAR
ncbi:MAG: hypothetical protein QOF53_4107 [Nocardioidaceae bacterium]|nr:hypothetical protein [Nocardioidaceae bacterium]